MRSAKKSLYLLPNAFTVASIFCGFLAMILAFKGQGNPESIYRASWLIGLSMFLDGMDGRVARLTNTQSAFGLQLDSLADVVAFGVAPAVVIYQWALADMGFVGVFAAFSFIACGAMRLARFNVQCEEDADDASNYFTGIPIPTAAGVLASFILMNIAFGVSPAGMEWPIMGLVMLMAFLMVSTVRYPTFKKTKMTPRARAVILGVVTYLVVVSVVWNFYLAVNLGLMLYIISGLMKSVLSMGRRRVRAARSDINN